jgi:transposase-like protein
MKNIEVIQRKPGRPRAIPEDRIEEVISLYKAGLGYRAIARELINQGICVDWSTVRRLIKKWLSKKDSHNGSCSNSDTVLPRGTLAE